jgi:MFS transporter, OFA family, oxalate/formate antiporter
LAQRALKDYGLAEALKTWQWWVLWFLLFLNTSAGISVISQEAPMFQELAGVTALTAGGMVGIASLGNGVGRVFWAWVSDTITRKATFAVMFAIQVVLFWIYPHIGMAGMLTLVTFVILMCYGGGFGTMPAFTADYFGPRNVGPIYGLMLTAWSFASAFGPLLIARIRETRGSYAPAMHLIAVILLVSIVLAIIVRPPGRETERERGAPAEERAA